MIGVIGYVALILAVATALAFYSSRKRETPAEEFDSLPRMLYDFTPEQATEAIAAIAKSGPFDDDTLARIIEGSMESYPDKAHKYNNPQAWALCCVSAAMQLLKKHPKIPPSAIRRVGLEGDWQ